MKKKNIENILTQRKDEDKSRKEEKHDEQVEDSKPAILSGCLS